ncbi:MAG: VWA domain-containing protein [Promethearchaeia archaeon]
MRIFPENPCNFAVDFIRRMRKHPDIVQAPSSRQVLSIPRLILARYYRKGKITPNDFIEIASVSSFPENQKLAKDIAFKVLFPNYQKDITDPFFEASGVDQFEEEDFLNEQMESELDDLQEMVEEIEYSDSIDTELIQQLENFMDEVNQNRDQEPYKSALQFFNDDSELFEEKISSLDSLLDEAEKRLQQKINSLNPKDLKAGSELGLNDVIEENSVRDWEKITSKALNDKDISKDLKGLFQKGDIQDLMETYKFLNESAPESYQREKNEILDQVEHELSNLDELFQASKKLGKNPSFNQGKVLRNSIEENSFAHNFNLADSLDQFFGTDLRKPLLDDYKESLENRGKNLPLETLANHPLASKSWKDLFNKTLQNEVQKAMNKKKSNESLKSLSHQLQQLMNSCTNMHCSQKMKERIPDIVRKTIESSKDPQQLKSSVEFLRNIDLSPEAEDIKKKGKELKMPDEEIYELIEPNYQLLKKLIDNQKGDFHRLSNLMQKLRDQLTHDRVKELTQSALDTDNLEALGALGHFDLNEALKSAQETQGKEGMEKMTGALTAGNGENLLKQWFIHRDEIPVSIKPKVKELAKKMLIDLGIYYSRSHLGSATTGPIPINIVRPYRIGDDFDNIDLEETLFNLLQKGKKLDYIGYDDFYVYETAQGLRSAALELDISGSMSGDKLTYTAICAAMLLYGLREDEIAISFFESDAHVIKNMDDEKDLEKIAEEILTLKAKGGTRLQRALVWANRQFKEKTKSREKLNVLFTDAEIFDFKEAVEEIKVMKSLNVDFIVVVPEEQFNLQDAEKMVKIAGGELLTINDWEEFPKLISDILKSRF